VAPRTARGPSYDSGRPADRGGPGMNCRRSEAADSSEPPPGRSSVEDGRRNCRHLVSVCRFGAGGIFGALRTRRIAEALTRWPELEQLALDPLVSPPVILAGGPDW
jgi:hypothetical protein